MSQAIEGRLRPHPAERFQAAEHCFDLRQAVQGLLQEPHAANHGHRQITLYHYGSVTVVLLAFQAGATLPEHAAEGLEEFFVLSGDITIRADNQVLEVGEHHLVLINPGVTRSLEAKADSQVLLTVHLGGDKHQDSPRRPEAGGNGSG